MLTDFIYTRICKPICAKFLTLPYLLKYKFCNNYLYINFITEPVFLQFKYLSLIKILLFTGIIGINLYPKYLRWCYTLISTLSSHRSTSLFSHIVYHPQDLLNPIGVLLLPSCPLCRLLSLPCLLKVSTPGNLPALWL